MGGSVQSAGALLNRAERTGDFVLNSYSQMRQTTAFKTYPLSTLMT
jgi:hypothetical protein